MRKRQIRTNRSSSSVLVAVALASLLPAPHPAVAMNCPTCDPPGGGAGSLPTGPGWSPTYPDMFTIPDPSGNVSHASMFRYPVGEPYSFEWRRFHVIDNAVREIYAFTGGGADGNTGLCEDDAKNRYDFTGPPFGDWSGNWCTEFARQILLWSGASDDTGLSSAITVSDMQDVFEDVTPLIWVERNEFDIRYSNLSVEPGDYLAMKGSDGSDFGHSGIVVGVSDDLKHLWTIEGNVTAGTESAHCVRLVKRPYIADGALHDKINAVGKSNYLLPANGPLAPTYSGKPMGYRRSDGREVIVYRGSDGHVYEHSGTGTGNLTAIAGAPLAAGDPWGYTRYDGLDTVLYRGTDGKLYELYYSGNWQVSYLGDSLGLPQLAGDPRSARLAAGNGDNVTFRADNNHVYQLMLYNGQWSTFDLTASWGGAAQGDPMAYARTDGTDVIVYRDVDDHIYEFHGPWQRNDLTTGAGAPLAAGNPWGYKMSEGWNVVLYRGHDDQLYELYSSSPAPWGGVGDWAWSNLGGPPPAAGDPFAMVGDDGVSRIYYRQKTTATNWGTTEHTPYRIIELTWQNEAYLRRDLSSELRAPVAVGDPRPFNRAGGILSLPYMSIHGHVYEMKYNAGAWSVHTLR